MSLGMRMGARSYAEYLADYPTLPLGLETVTELVAQPQPIATSLAQRFQTA